MKDIMVGAICAAILIGAIGLQAFIVVGVLAVALFCIAVVLGVVEQ